jgi:hypothetical protein
MSKVSRDDIISYREMCDLENVQTLQRGMNYRLNQNYSVLLMSRRTNAPYNDRVYEDGVTIEYEGHDITKRSGGPDPKSEGQPRFLPSGTLTQNGKFMEAVEGFKSQKRSAELVKVYEKVLDGVWSLKGIFRLIDYKVTNHGNRNVYRFILALDPNQQINIEPGDTQLTMTRVIPTRIKQAVWKRDKGQCVICGSSENIHFDHELPYSKGGTSLSEKNVRLLCMKHNLQKSAKIE